MSSVARDVPPTQFVNVPSGATIAYRLFPCTGKRTDGVPLVMVQGLSGVKEDWRSLLPKFTVDRRVLVLDNRGIGESKFSKEATKKGFTLADLAQDVIDTAAHVFGRDTPFNLMGISMGGAIVQELTLRAPRLVLRLILGCTSAAFFNRKARTGSDSKEIIEANLAYGRNSVNTKRPTNAAEALEIVRTNLKFTYTPEFVRDAPHRFDELVRSTLQQRRPLRVIIAQQKAISTYDVSEKISTIKCPTMVVHGDLDVMVPLSKGRFLEKTIPNSTFVLLRGAGHVFWDMDHGESAVRIRNFLREGERSRM